MEFLHPIPWSHVGTGGVGTLDKSSDEWFGRVDKDDDEEGRENRMLQIATRIGARAMVLGTTLLSGCSIVPPDFEQLPARADGVHPATAAWALAVLCRAEHPSTDPLESGPVPVLREADGSFTIHIARSGADAPYRCAMNGRLAAPIPSVGDGGTLRLAAPRFVPARHRTRAPGSSDQLTIVVRPEGTDARGPAVSIAFRGEAASPTLRARLSAAIDALHAASTAADEIEAGEPARAGRTAAAFLERLDTEGITGLGLLLGPIHAQLASSLVASGDLARARQSLSLAQRAAPHCHALGRRIAELDARLARTDAAASLLDQIADDPRGGAATRIASALPQESSPSRGISPSTTARLAHREARRRLHAGDLAGAAAWASRALEHAGDPTLGLDLELARARGDHRTAFVLGVEQLARFGFDPELVLSMADDAAAYGDPGAGVRLLARHWDELERTAPTPLRSTADRLASAAGTDLTARIALTEGCRRLSSRVLDPLGRAGILLEIPRTRLASLQRRAAPPAPRPQLLDAGFELGPGITPAR